MKHERRYDMNEKLEKNVSKTIVDLIETLSSIAERQAEKKAASLLAYTGLLMILIGLVYRAIPVIQLSAEELITLFILGFLSVLCSAATRVWLYKEETKRADLLLDFERKAHERSEQSSASRSDEAEKARQKAQEQVG
jgi:hypothetical protein